MNTADFRQLVWNFYKEHGRDNLPWRNTVDPYAIYISEMMLQQTQASRVIEKYESWLADFPDFKAVAEASKKSTLNHWQGLGYNRRALYIKETCKTIVEGHDGKLPKDKDILLELPGIGPYTAGAIQAFAYNVPAVFVETNIRTVFIHHFFVDKKNITDTQITEKISETLPEENPREWYAALMDYGAHLKKEVGNLNSQAKKYQKQSKFAGSNRQLRAKVTRFILAHGPVKISTVESEFHELVSKNKRMKPTAEVLNALADEGFIARDGETVTTSD